jgi:hypothetical protein
MVSLTMTRTFNIPYGESALYSCAEITALTDIVSFFASSQVVTVLLRYAGKWVGYTRSWVKVGLRLTSKWVKVRSKVN